MSNIVFNDGKILFDGDKIAFDLDCCCESRECPRCQAGSTPTQLAVSFTNIDNRAGVGLPCDCDAIFDPLVLFILDQVPGIPCLWEIVDVPGFFGCAINAIVAELQLDAGNFFLRVTIQDQAPIDNIDYVINLGNNAPNCTAFANQVVPWDILGNFQTSLCIQGALPVNAEAFVTSL